MRIERPAAWYRGAMDRRARCLLPIVLIVGACAGNPVEGPGGTLAETSSGSGPTSTTLGVTGGSNTMSSASAESSSGTPTTNSDATDPDASATDPSATDATTTDATTTGQTTRDPTRGESSSTGSGTGCIDVGEPDDTPDEATPLANLVCDGFASAEGVLDAATSPDAWHFDGDGNANCYTPQIRVHVAASESVRICAYATCVGNAGLGVDCLDGSAPDGNNGCCAADDLHFTNNCMATGNEDAAIDIVFSGALAACLDYSFDYEFF